MGMFQIAAVGVAGALFAILFKSQKPEYGIYISVALGLFLFFHILGYLESILSAFRQLMDSIHLDRAYLTTLLKMIGIAYLAEFASGICKDAGYQTIAGQIEIAGKLMILALSLPILTTLLETIQGFLT